MTARIRIRDETGTLRTITRIRVRDESGILRTIRRVRIRDDGNVLRTVFEYLSPSLSPTTISETGTTATYTTTATCTVTVAGGTGPFTYAWFNSYGDPILAVSPTSATTAFRKSAIASGDSYQAVFYCDVTDAFGLTSRTSNGVDVTIARS